MSTIRRHSEILVICTRSSSKLKKLLADCIRAEPKAHFLLRSPDLFSESVRDVYLYVQEKQLGHLRYQWRHFIITARLNKGSYKSAGGRIPGSGHQGAAKLVKCKWAGFRYCCCSLQTAAGALRRLSEFHWGANLPNFNLSANLSMKVYIHLQPGVVEEVKMRMQPPFELHVRAQNKSAFEGIFLTTISPRCKFSCLAIPSATWLELLQSTFLCTTMTCNWAIQILVNKFPVASTSHADVLLSSHPPNCSAGPNGIQLLVTAVPSHQASSGQPAPATAIEP
jgi:hypothetical protein